MKSTELVLPTYEELSRGMDLAMQRGMVAAMSGDEDGRARAQQDIRHYADRIRAGEYQ